MTSCNICHRECQRIDWPSYKGPCRETHPFTPANSPMPESIMDMFLKANPGFLEGLLGDEAKGAHGPSPPSGLDQAIAYPFTVLENGTYLHDRPEKDVYRILIDSYRFRMEEYCGSGGQIPENTVYNGQDSSLPHFREYLQLAATRPGLLPSWWSPKKQRECEDFGMFESEFQDLHKALEEHGATWHYRDSRFPPQLRMLAEAVYETGINGRSSFPRRRELAQMEARRRESEAGQA
ncbi:hypothetical protein BHE90_011619 [Fusarium euwallaceae]|uniref:MYND-type zinc finger protein samB n=4 Tax=Fusarium solani species complex TaxID=232080 RepID=A0A3M2RX15_9HYPO|nr:hypothetical protein CDV36_010566 [Fusarium kuroshium]RSL78743.1 hypothetical protein CEP51_007933 [Fusarium floridanum]RSM04253.1 hypothetical protein CDV31_010112 [Fusarium ambrosium]RTE73942.1 hypothetical protein BHE90_011619 [Fusarium euwallaceae]